MYVLLMAMLAMNVSSDVLNGFTLVQESLNKTLHSAELKNTALYNQFDDLKAQNPQKVGEWLDKANEVKKQTQALYDEIEQLKVDMAKAADGETGDYHKLQSKDNTDVGAQIALDSTKPQKEQRGVILKGNLNTYGHTFSYFEVSY